MKCNKVVVVCGEKSQLVYYGFLNNNHVCFDGADICIKVETAITMYYASGLSNLSSGRPRGFFDFIVHLLCQH